MSQDTADASQGVAADVTHADVLIIGAGPVGLAAALLIARRGWRVTVLERHLEPYPQPRAVHFDDEVARVLADAGLAGELARLTDPADIYEWRNGREQTLLRFDWSGTGPSGWPMASMFNQPALEDALARAADSPAGAGGLTVLRGYEAVQLRPADDAVEVVARDRAGERHRFTAGWAIGCDGANSFVRGHMQSGLTDLGFFFDWLIVDVVPNEPRSWNPVNLQICDPQRPTTVVSGGPGRRRWEFMRMPGETAEELNNEETAWRLLAPWKLTPENSVLERHAIYTFQARWVDRWRDGRLLLAGDSAHVQHAIGMSVELGKVICVTDPGEAAGRDGFMIGQGADPARILPPLPPPTLTDGIIRRAADGEPAPGAGQLTPQPTVGYRGRTGLLDEIVGIGFVLACAEDPAAALDGERRSFLDAIGARVLRVVPASAVGETVSGDPADLADLADVVVDVDGGYLAQLAAAGHVAALVRPDHYLFGGVASTAELPGLVDDLRRQLTGVPAS